KKLHSFPTRRSSDLKIILIVDVLNGYLPIDRFTDIKEVGEGGFAKVYSAIWIDGYAYYRKQDDGSWKKDEPDPIKVALKRLNGSDRKSTRLNSSHLG